MSGRGEETQQELKLGPWEVEEDVSLQGTFGALTF